MNEKIPEGWNKKRLGELGEFKTSSVDKKINENEIPGRLINYMDVYIYNFIKKDIELMEVTANRHQYVTNKVVKGDVLFTPTSETPDDIGHSAVVLDEMEDTLYSYHLIRLRSNYNNLLDLKFRGYVFNSRYVLHQFERLATGVTRFTLSKKDFENVDVIFPESIFEQRKIAEILETIDKAIEQTDKIIEKYKRIKQGLMQDLLTKGIDENWQIRSEKTHKFKDSELGKIPQEWEVVILGNEELLKLETGGTPPTDNIKFWNGDIPWLTSGEVHKKRIFDTDKKISKLGYKHSNAKYIPKHSILIALAGQGKTRGTVAINYIELTTNQSVAAIIPNKAKVDYEFVFYHLEHDYLKLRAISLGSGRAGLNLKVLREYKIVFPPLDEQKRIASVLSQIDEVIEKEQRYKEKLEKIKKGLMEDLLTGKVRVNNLIDESTETSREVEA